MEVCFWLCHKSVFVTTSQAYAFARWTMCQNNTNRPIYAFDWHLRRANYSTQKTKINSKFTDFRWFFLLSNGPWTVVHCSVRIQSVCSLSTQTADAISFCELKCRNFVSFVSLLVSKGHLGVISRDNLACVSQRCGEHRRIRRWKMSLTIGILTEQIETWKFPKLTLKFW